MRIRPAAAGLSAAVLLAAAPALAGCQSSGSHAAAVSSASAAAKTAVAQITSSPKFKADELAAQKCVTAGGRLVTVLHCIAPPGHSRARDKCLRGVVVSHLTTKAARAQIPGLAAACAEENS